MAAGVATPLPLNHRRLHDSGRTAGVCHHNLAERPNKMVERVLFIASTARATLVTEAVAAQAGPSLHTMAKVGSPTGVLHTRAHHLHHPQCKWVMVILKG